MQTDRRGSPVDVSTARSNLLQAASGRYAEEIVVPGGQATVSNPTGKATISGVPLRRVPASRYPLQDNCSS